MDHLKELLRVLPKDRLRARQLVVIPVLQLARKVDKLAQDKVDRADTLKKPDQVNQLRRRRSRSGGAQLLVSWGLHTGCRRSHTCAWRDHPPVQPGWLWLLVFC